METEQYLEQLTRNADRLADAAAAAGVGAPVPTCPGWTVADLLDHLVRGDNWARAIVERGQAGHHRPDHARVARRPARG